MSQPRTHLTPKQLADAIGASESSLRRWVDGGRIRMSRTAGGHRRIPIAEAVRFIREMGSPVVRPELLGIGPVGAMARTPLGESELFAALIAGERDAASGMVVTAYLGGQRLPALFDGPIRGAMHRVGELWKHDARGILVEHRATDMCVGTLARLRELLPPPAADAPLALGGAPEGDPYLLPSAMADLVLTELGVRSVNFGANTPIELLGREAVDRGARLVWLSVSVAEEAKSLRRSVEDLATTLARRSVALVVGGARAAASLHPLSGNFVVAETMAELAAFVRGSLSAHVAPSGHAPRAGRSSMQRGDNAI